MGYNGTQPDSVDTVHMLAFHHHISSAFDGIQDKRVVLALPAGEVSLEVLALPWNSNITRSGEAIGYMLLVKRIGIARLVLYPDFTPVPRRVCCFYIFFLVDFGVLEL